MGCGALLGSSAKDRNDETNSAEYDSRRDEAARKIQAVFTAKADQELKAVENAASEIVQKLAAAVRQQDEAAVRYELVQIQKLAPPGIALARAHAGGRTIVLPEDAAKALVADIRVLLEVGPGVQLGVLISIERALKLFSWPGHAGSNLIAGDTGAWELDLGQGASASPNVGNVWQRLRLQVALGRLLEVLNDTRRWQIDSATLALQELQDVCANYASNDQFDAAVFLPNLLCPEDLEVEFGQGTQWERSAAERQQVLLAATFHVGGDEAVSQLLKKAADLARSSVPTLCLRALWLLLWDGFVRCAQNLRPSLFWPRETSCCHPGDLVRVMGHSLCPELNGVFGEVLSNDAIIQPEFEDEVPIRVGRALAVVDSQNLAHRASTEPQCELGSVVRLCGEDHDAALLGYLTMWLDELADDSGANECCQPNVGTAMSSQFTETKGRHACGVCGTFRFAVDCDSLESCVICGSQNYWGETCRRNASGISGGIQREFSRRLGAPEGDEEPLAEAQWQCPECKELFDHWEDDDDEEGLLSHLMETGHAKTKHGKKAFCVMPQVSEQAAPDPSLVKQTDGSIDEELQILRIFRLIPSRTTCVELATFHRALLGRCKQLPAGSRNALAISANLVLPGDQGQYLLHDELQVVASTFRMCRDALVNRNLAQDKNTELHRKWMQDLAPAWEILPKLSPSIRALALGLRECEELMLACRQQLAKVPDQFADLKEALLAISDVPGVLFEGMVESKAYQSTLTRCRVAGELPSSWDLETLFDSVNNRKQNQDNNAQEIRKFMVTVQKRPEEKLGLDIDSVEGSRIKVMGVVEGSVFSKWNAANPNSQVKAGDFIVGINGASGGLKELTEAAKGSSLKVLILRKPEAKTNMDSDANRKTLDSSLVSHFQGIVDATWSKKWTHDRKGDPWGEDVPSNFVVQEVVQVQNMKAWQDYLDVRRQIKSRVTDGKCPTILQDIDKAMTTAPGAKLIANYSVAGGALKPQLNEAWLWHGTKPMAADTIVASDFEISRAGSHRGTLYGNGIYLAECSTKADEYCREVNDRGWRSMLLCRCILGKYYFTNTAATDTSGQECQQAVTKGDWDSVLGDRRRLRGTFREFVFYDHRQVYPCFLVFYTRGSPIPRPEPKKKADS